MISKTVAAALLSLLALSCSQIQRENAYRIQGALFWDANRNGVRDAWEGGLPDRKIFLYGAGDDSTRTDSSGNYAFTGLTEGNYLLAQEFRTSWSHSYPRSGMHAARRRRNTNIRLFRQLCRIAEDVRRFAASSGSTKAYQLPTDLQEDEYGHYWCPQTNNDERAIQGSAFGGDALLTTSVDRSGLLSWKDDTSSGGWMAAGTRIVNVSSKNPVRSGLDFGTFPSEMSGRVFLNGRDSISGLAGWTVVLHGPSPMVAVSDSLGRYRFRDFEWGRYVISLEPRAGFDLVAPAMLATPAEQRIEERSRMQDRLDKIYERANASYANFSRTMTSYSHFALPTDLAQDDAASYALLKADRDTLLLRATLRSGKGAIVVHSSAFQFTLQRTETDAMIGSARSAPGSWMVPNLEPYGWSGDLNWMDFGVAQRGVVSGKIKRDGETNDQNDGTAGESARTVVYFAGPAVDSILAVRTGAYSSPELIAGAYIVSCDRAAEQRSMNAEHRASSPRRGVMIQSLNNCAHLLSLIAADAYRYRILSTHDGGGGGIYQGYSVPPSLAVTTAALSSVGTDPISSLLIAVESAEGRGRITACLDDRGLLQDVKIEGGFAALQSKVVYTELHDPHVEGVDF